MNTYLAQHGEIEPPVIDGTAYRPFWRRRTRIEQLFGDGAIRIIDYRAALVYRGLAEAVAGEARAAMRTEPSDASGSRDGSRVRHAGAAQRLMLVRQQIGGFAARLCDQVIIADLPWAELGRRYHVDPKTARAWAITAIAALPPVMFASRP
jgi:hypothetical protein